MLIRVWNNELEKKQNVSKENNVLIKMKIQRSTLWSKNPPIKKQKSGNKYKTFCKWFLKFK